MALREGGHQAHQMPHESPTCICTNYKNSSVCLYPALRFLTVDPASYKKSAQILHFSQRFASHVSEFFMRVAISPTSSSALEGMCHHMSFVSGPPVPRRPSPFTPVPCLQEV